MSERCCVCLPAADLTMIDRLAAELATRLRPGDVALLVGDLGAGKTTFTKVLAGHLGVDHEVTSPTFTIAHGYSTGRGAAVPVLMHLDAYRLRGADDLEAVGLFEALDDGAAAIIEWGDIVERAIDDPLAISLAFVDETHRSVTLSCAPDSAWTARLAELGDAIGALPC